MSAMLFVILIPAVLAFIFAVFVAYYAFADVEERLDFYYGYHDKITLSVPGS
jgi:hypothetical protein